MYGGCRYIKTIYAILALGPGMAYALYQAELLYGSVYN